MGSAVDIRARWKRHVYALRAGTHDNPHLQKAWNKYGPEAFRFEILDLCPIAEMLICEQEYIDERAEYNRAQIAGNCLGLKHSNETRLKLSASRQTKENRERASLAQKAVMADLQHRARIVAAMNSQEAKQHHADALRGKPWTAKRRSSYLTGVGR